MATQPLLLLVDPEELSRRVLEVSLGRAGFRVQVAETAEAALEHAVADHPAVVITAALLPDLDGFELIQTLKSEASCKDTPVLLLTDDGAQAAQVRAAQAGAEAVLAKPVLVKEVLAAVMGLLERQRTQQLRRRERPGNLSGTLGNLSLVDLLQLMEAGRRSGIVHISSDPVRSGGFVTGSHARATLFFRDGDPIDAKLGEVVGLNVIYRVMLWEDGQFEVRFQSLDREDRLQTSTQTVLLEGMRRLDEWSRLGAALPRANTALVVDYGRISELQLSEAQQEALPLFDGRRSILEVSERLPEGLTRISELVQLGALRDPSQKKLSPAPQFSLTGNLPRELEEAVVPSSPPSVDLTQDHPPAVALQSPPTLELQSPSLPAGATLVPASPPTLELTPPSLDVQGELQLSELGAALGLQELSGGAQAVAAADPAEVELSALFATKPVDAEADEAVEVSLTPLADDDEEEDEAVEISLSELPGPAPSPVLVEDEALEVSLSDQLDEAEAPAGLLAETEVAAGEALEVSLSEHLVEPTPRAEDPASIAETPSEDLDRLEGPAEAAPVALPTPSSDRPQASAADADVTSPKPGSDPVATDPADPAAEGDKDPPAPFIPHTPESTPPRSDPPALTHVPAERSPSVMPWVLAVAALIAVIAYFAR